MPGSRLQNFPWIIWQTQRAILSVFTAEESQISQHMLGFFSKPRLPPSVNHTAEFDYLSISVASIDICWCAFYFVLRQRECVNHLTRALSIARGCGWAAQGWCSACRLVLLHHNVANQLGFQEILNELLTFKHLGIFSEKVWIFSKHWQQRVNVLSR